MKRALLLSLAVVACKKSAPEATPDGYVIRVHLESRISPADVHGIQVVLSKKTGFPEFSDRAAGEVEVVSRDTDGDALNEVVLTWSESFDFEQTQYVRLRFNNQSPMQIAIAGTASDGSGRGLASGSLDVTVPGGGEGVADLTLECLNADCSAVVPADAGGDGSTGAEPQPDTGGAQEPGAEPAPDAGAPEPTPDQGVMPEPPPDLSTTDTTLTQVGEFVSAAGTSGSGSLVLQHEVGHVVGHGSSSQGSTALESVLTITR